MLEEIKEQQKITEDYVHSVDQYRKENEALREEVERLKYDIEGLLDEQRAILASSASLDEVREAYEDGRRECDLV